MSLADHADLCRRALLAGAATTLLTGAAWPVVEPGRLVVRRHAFAFAGWPAGHGALRVVFITDLHVGCPHVGLERVQSIVARANAEAPDLILLGGDYVQGVVGGRFIAPEATAAVLAGLRARLGVYSVLGNHDWGLSGRRVAQALEGVGIAVLENQALRLGGERPFWLAGFADDSTRQADVAGTLAQVANGAPVLALAHDPATFAEITDRPLLTLCGHTHGGQVWLPFYGACRIPSRAPRRWAYGHIVEGGRHLLVSGGVGTSLLPIRVGVPPEIVVIDITAAA